jgi:RimJ/RimL family protein N-acetyltransferase
VPAPAQLRTERLHLRPPTRADTSRVVALSTDPRVNRHSPTGPPTVQQSRAAVREAIAAWHRDGIGHWLVEYNARLVGVTGARPITLPGDPLQGDLVQGNPYWNVYYRFAPETWGRGIASEAVRAALAAARDHLPGRPFVVRTRPTNEPAIQLAQAVGLTCSPQLDADGFVTFIGD